MSVGDDMRERHGRVLAELAEAGMVMVRRLSTAMSSTDDIATQAQVGLAYHRVSRAVRQTLALEFRLAQDTVRGERGADAAARPSPARPAETAGQRPAAERTGWSEHERDDSDEALDPLDALLEADELDIGTVRDAVAASIARIHRDLAADPLLVKAGAVPAGVASPERAAPAAAGPRRPAPDPVGRRSRLMGATTLARPLLQPSPGAAWRSSG